MAGWGWGRQHRSRVHKWKPCHSRGGRTVSYLSIQRKYWRWGSGRCLCHRLLRAACGKQREEHMSRGPPGPCWASAGSSTLWPSTYRAQLTLGAYSSRLTGCTSTVKLPTGLWNPRHRCLESRERQSHRLRPSTLDSCPGP